jgi:uncharacterized protein YndB with AHSA1/START domain
LLAQLVSPAAKPDGIHVSRRGDLEIVLARTFAAPRETVFEALTQPRHLLRWMGPGTFRLVDCEVDLRAGGSFRYGFERPSGARIEVRGAYASVEPPRGYAYTESYDFSPLRVSVQTTLERAGDETRFEQTLTYASRRERDADFEGVAASSREAYASLERYLASAR